MKVHKRLIVVAIILLLSFTTYAVYRTGTSVNGSLKTAAWNVKIAGTRFEQANFTFDVSNVIWTSNPGHNNTIAPGATGYISIPIDATGSEVDVKLTATLGQMTLPSGMTVAIHGNNEQTILYDANDMSTTIRIDVNWSGAVSDTQSKDNADKAASGITLSIPVTLTAQQTLDSGN